MNCQSNKVGIAILTRTCMHLWNRCNKGTNYINWYKSNQKYKIIYKKYQLKCCSNKNISFKLKIICLLKKDSLLGIILIWEKCGENCGNALELADFIYTSTSLQVTYAISYIVHNLSLQIYGYNTYIHKVVNIQIVNSLRSSLRFTKLITSSPSSFYYRMCFDSPSVDWLFLLILFYKWCVPNDCCVRDMVSMCIDICCKKS